jgi:mycoredoxin
MDDHVAGSMSSSEGDQVEARQVPTVYSATWCGYCHRLKKQLERAGIPYQQVDVDEDPSVLPKLEELNGGEWIIPTVEFPDGTALVNPSVAAVAAKLQGDQ